MNCPAIDGLQRRDQGLAPLGQSIFHGRRDVDGVYREIRSTYFVPDEEKKVIALSEK